MGTSKPSVKKLAYGLAPFLVPGFITLDAALSDGWTFWPTSGVVATVAGILIVVRRYALDRRG